MAGKQPTVTGNKVVFNNFTNAFSLNEADNAKPDSKDHTEYKPFKLSKYIEAEPFDRIVLWYIKNGRNYDILLFTLS